MAGAAISGLHNLGDDLGLVAALESRAQMAGRAGVPSIALVVDPSAAVGGIADHAAAALSRIAQETLANAVKHAAAQRTVLSVREVGDSLALGCAVAGRASALRSVVRRGRATKASTWG